MKKAFKKFLIIALSLITATCFLVGCDEEEIDNGTVTGENFSPSSYVTSVTAENGTVDYKEETLVGNGKVVKGVVLTGGEKSKYDLGDINIAKSKWQGEVNTITGEYTSFIDFFYAPTQNASELVSFKITLSDTQKSTNYVEILVNNYKKDRNSDFSNDLMIMAKAVGQAKYASYLNAQTVVQSNDGKNYTASMALKSGYYGDCAKYAGCEDGTLISPKGNQNVPVSIVYDKESNALYSPVTNSIETEKSSFKTSYAIRKFDNVYGDKSDNSDPVKWSGFSSDVVNVSIEFIDLNEVDSTSLIITGVGGYDISKDSVFVADTDYVKSVPSQPKIAMQGESVTLCAPLNYTVINSTLNEGSKVVITKNGFTDTVNFTEKTKSYTFNEAGDYNLDFYYGNGDKAKTVTIKVSSSILTTETLAIETSANASATYGTYKQLSVSAEFTGLRLTGKTGAKFDLGAIDIGKSDWAGNYNSASKPSGGNTNESILEMLFDPHDNIEFRSSGGGGTGELSNVTLTFTQGSESMSIRMSYYSYTDDKAGHEVMVTTKAGNQLGFGAYRSNLEKLTGGIRKGRIVKSDFSKFGLNGKEDLFSGCWGTSTVALPIYYDFNDVALYTPSQYQATADGLNDAYLIRDFNSTEAKYNSPDPSIIETWSGFKKDSNGRCVVNVTAEFGTVRGTSPSSVIITKLGNYDFTLGSIDLKDSDYVKDRVNVVAETKVGAEITLTPPYKKWHALYALAYEDAIVEIYKQGESNKIDTVTFNKTAQTYTFNTAGVYELKYYDAPNGKQIGTTKTITVT